MTDPLEVDETERIAVRTERIAALRRSRVEAGVALSARGATAPLSGRKRRAHPALGSRIAAAGIGASAMLGIVAGLGAASHKGSPVLVSPTAGEGAPVEVVLDRDPATDDAARPSAVVAVPPSDAPIELTANPVVRTVEVPAAAAAAPAAPVARTNGSN